MSLFSGLTALRGPGIEHNQDPPSFQPFEESGDNKQEARRASSCATDPLSALKHDSSVARQASPPSSSHYWVTQNPTSLHMPPPTSKFPKEMSRPPTHPHTHTYTLSRTHPVTNDHGNTNLKIFSQGLRAGVALALGSKCFRDPRHGGRRGMIP